MGGVFPGGALFLLLGNWRGADLGIARVLPFARSRLPANGEPKFVSLELLKPEQQEVDAHFGFERLNIALRRLDPKLRVLPPTITGGDGPC